jgi:hypothetical protein
MDSDDEHPPSTKGPGSVVLPRAAREGERERAERADAERAPPIGLDVAYAMACKQMADVRPTAPGYRLFWIRRREVGWMDLPDGGAYAIVGHHPECDAKLQQMPGIALRHLLATTVRLADGLALRVLDLQTPFPFHLADGVPRRSLVVAGPVAFHLGDYVIGGVPVEEDGMAPGKLQLPSGPLPRAVVSEGRTLPPSLRPPRGVRPTSPVELRGARDLDAITHVTSLPPTSTIGQRPRRGLARGVGAPSEHGLGGEALEAAALDELGRDEPGCAWVTLRRAGQSAGVELREGELDRGVVVGRAEGCVEALKTVLDINISRGHLLLLHHHGVFEAFDLCSTQGTYVNGHAVRRFVLPDQGATLQLATREPVFLEWKRVLPSAG